MTCPNEKLAVDTIVDYCAGALDAPAAAGVEKHLLECAACEELVKAQKSAWKLLDEWHPPVVSNDFDARLYRMIEEEKQGSWARRFWNSVTKPGFSPAWRPILPLGAATLALALAFMLHIPSGPVLSPLSNPAASKDQPGVRVETVSATQTVDLESALDDLDMLTPMSPRGGAI